MRRTKALAVGACLTVAFACLAAHLVFFSKQLHPMLLLIIVILFQLSFMWTCAEFIDRPDDRKF